MFEMYGNTITDVAFAAAVFLLIVGAGLFLRRVLISRIAAMAKKTKTRVDDFLLIVVQSFGQRFYLILATLVTVLFFLETPDIIGTVAGHLLVIFIGFETVIVLFRIVEFCVGEIAKKISDDKHEMMSTAIPTLRILAKVVISFCVLTFVLSNLGVDITTLIAGLGIGGLVFAFAFQKILADLFSTFVIFFDKPFSIGDTISTDTISGTIERVGVKTSHIRAYTGERVVVPNEDLVSMVVWNTTNPPARRTTLLVPVSYETDDRKLEKIPAHIEEIVAAHEKTAFVYARVQEFGEYAILFEVIYNNTDATWDEHIDTRHAVLLDILKRFDAEGIELGYPIQLSPHRGIHGGKK